jgi:hypothetical protein
VLVVAEIVDTGLIRPHTAEGTVTSTVVETVKAVGQLAGAVITTGMENSIEVMVGVALASVAV